MRLRGLRAVDLNGNTKFSKVQLGTGASLQDPVIVSQGGIGLTSCVQGDLLYGYDSTAKTFPTPSVSTPVGMVLLSNEAANLNLTGQYSNGQYNNFTRGWLGYNGVTQLTEAQAVSAAFPSGTPVAYFATSDVATALEALIIGIPVVRTLPKDASGIKLLTNTGTSFRPAWADPLTILPFVPDLVTRKSAVIQWVLTLLSGLSHFWTLPTQDGTIANLTEPAGIWIRAATAASSGTDAGHLLPNNWCWLDHNPTLRCVLRVNPTLSNLRIWVVLSNAAAAITNADDQHALKGVGLRYSTGASDHGWVTWKSDGTTQTIGGAAVTTIAGFGIYPISIAVTGGGANFTVTIGDATSTVAIPAGALGTMMRFQIQVTTTDGVSKVLDFLSGIYGEWD